MKIVGTILLLVVCATWSSAQWENGQAAEYVIGQGSFTTRVVGTAADSLSNPFFVAIDEVNGKLYVSDSDNNRVLRFAYPFYTNKPTAEYVFGQANMTSKTSGSSSSKFDYPLGVSVRGDTLWVCDKYNDRIMRFDNASTSSVSQPNANGILGLGTLFQPSDCAISPSGALWVADAYHVWRFDNAGSKLNTSSADGFLGQTAADSYEQGPTQRIGYHPSGICLDGFGRLWVAYDLQSRILRFDDANTKPSGSPADQVIGQENYTSSTAFASIDELSSPTDVVVDASGRLYVADAGNSRIMIFDAVATQGEFSADADVVLGHLEMDQGASGTSDTTMYYCSGIDVDDTNGKILVVDLNNNRVLQFSSTTTLPVELVAFKANALAGSTVLEWETATEENNAGFEIERRAVGEKFSADPVWQIVGRVQGAGTSNIPREYSFSDVALTPGRYAYRLKQIDNDGAYSYSLEVEVEIVDAPTELTLGQNYPNPFNPETVIGYSLLVVGEVNLRVYDLLGREVAVLVNEVQSPGTYTVPFNGSSLASGTYVYRLQANGETITKVMTLLR